MLNRPLPCLIRTLPALTHRDQLIRRSLHLVSHHSTAIPSARHVQQPSIPKAVPSQSTDPIPQPITIPNPTSFQASTWTPHPRHLRTNHALRA
jgi:hypothetical protein